VRVYQRDTPDWLALSFDAKALYVLILHKADRRGRIALGRLGRKGVAVVLGHVDLWPRFEPALADLEADGCIRVEGGVLAVAEFVEAQEAVSSGKARQAKLRAAQKARDEASPERDEASPSGDVSSTKRDARVQHSTVRTVQHGTDGTDPVGASVPSKQKDPSSLVDPPVLTARTGSQESKEGKKQTPRGPKGTLADIVRGAKEG